MITNGSRKNNFQPFQHIHNIKVLMYHNIVDDENTNTQWTNINKEEFSKHLSLLDKWGFTPITFKDYLLFINGELLVPKKPVILTFDDGFEGVYKIAFPLLKKLGWNAVVFAIGDKKIRKDLWNNNFGNKVSNLLNPEQILEMHDAGFEIGSHSMSHQYLPNKPYSNSWYEIVKSKEELENLIGSEVQSFCYPYGALNKYLKQMVKIAGYSIGCGVYTGPPKFGQDIFDVRRITIPRGTNSFSFAIKLLTPFEYYEFVGSKVLHKRSNNETVDKIEYKVELETKIKQSELI